MNYSLISVLAICLLIHVAHASFLHLSDQEATEKFKAMVQVLHRSLDGRQYSDVGNLRNFISQANEGLNVQVPRAEISKAAYPRGIAAFLKQRDGDFVRSKGGKGIFEEKFEKVVVGSCKIVAHQLEQNEKAYSTLMHRDSALRSLDMDSLEWLTNVRICLDILRDRDHIARKTFEVLGGKKGSVLGRIIHKLHDVIDRRRR